MYCNFRGEYFLTDYISKIENFDFEALHIGWQTEGYFYDSNYEGGSTLRGTIWEKLVKKRTDCSTVVGNKRRYEFAYIPYAGFLASPELLLKDCELKLSFDRANPNIALTKMEESTPPTTIEIVDCYAMTEYISSPGIRNFFDSIDQQPISYEYEETEVLIKSLPKDTTNIQIDNIQIGRAHV